MSWLNPYRWLAAVVLLALLLLGVWRLDMSRQAVGYDKARAEYTAAALKADQAARAREQSLQTQVTKAQSDAQIRSKTLQAAADSARHSADSLRDQLAAARSRLPSATQPAAVEYADSASQLLADCSRRYQDVARQADGHANDALMLLEAWPK